METRKRTARDILRGAMGDLGFENPPNDSDYLNEIGWDSLDIAELLVSIEDETELVIPERDVENFTTWGEVVAYLERRLTTEKEDGR
jgi:acyl carrier protein